MAGVFINAATARSDTLNAVVIHNEVTAIESAVLAGVAAGVLSANVTSGTAMTDSVDYYNAFFFVTEDPSRRTQIKTVENYFLDLGYGVQILTNQAQDRITWNINW